MTVLETPRLVLRPWTEDDAAEMFAIFADAEAMRFWNVPPPDTVEDMQATIRHSITAPPEVHAAWAIVLKQTGRIAGFLNYHHRDIRNARLEVGYVLARFAWGQGLGIEAVSAFVEHCFKAMDVNRVEATIDPHNAASMHLAERVGFRRESIPMRGRLKMPDGCFADVLMYGLLASDWRDRARYPSPRLHPQRAI
jgi:ribosomal-protein-alanine N-acetyltransferase